MNTCFCCNAEGKIEVVTSKETHSLCPKCHEVYLRNLDSVMREAEERLKTSGAT